MDGPWLVGRCGQLNLLNLYIFLKLFVETVEDYKVAGKAADLQWIMRKKAGEVCFGPSSTYFCCLLFSVSNSRSSWMGKLGAGEVSIVAGCATEDA